MKESQRLTDEISALLREGATLDDPRIQRLTSQRGKVHEDVDDFAEAARQEEKQAANGQEISTMRPTETLDLKERARRLSDELAQSDDPALRETGNTMIYGRGPRHWVSPQTTTQKAGPQPFERFGEMLSAVVTAARQPNMTDHRLKEMQEYALGLGETIPSEGGFLVQTAFTDDLLSRIHETGKLIALPRHIPISARSNGLKINAVDETSRVDGSRLGGVQAFWTAEAATITKSKPKFRQVEMTLHKLAGLYYATDEELMDTAALEETVGGFFAEEFAFKLDDALIRGSGAGEPLGILGHAGTVEVAAEDGQAAKTIVVENIENMFTRLWARSTENAVWLINQDVWRQIFALEKAVGTAGVPVFLPAGSIAGKPFNTLLGLPILPIEQCETLGTVGDIILADFSTGYVMIDKGGIDAAVSIHVEFLTDQMVFRFILRTDGQPIANAPLTPYKGTETQSPFITLATRS